MKIKTNQFNEGLRKNEKQIGLWLSLSNNISAEVIAPAGFDWALIDMEHSPNDLASVMGQLQVLESYPVTAIVRPPSIDPVVVKRLLDSGAPGILFPMVDTVEDGLKAIAATRYPPHGIRGVAGSTRATRFGRISDYVNEVEQQTAVLLQIESLRGLKNALDIGKLEGVTGILFGPADIAADMGLVGQPMSQRVWDEILPVARNLIELGVPVGTLVLDANYASELLNSGFSFVACGADSALLAKASDKLLLDVKAKLN